MSGDKKNEPPASDTQPDSDAIDFHGAAIIGEDGREIPITEDMIKDACKKLDPEVDAEDEKPADD